MHGLFIHICLHVYQNSQLNSKYTFSIKYFKICIFNVEKKTNKWHINSALDCII